MVDEHHFLNETAAQLRQAAQLRPLPPGQPPVTVITGDRHDHSLPAGLNDAWETAAAAAAERAGAARVRIDGADGRLPYLQPERLAAALRAVVRARRARLAATAGSGPRAEPVEATPSITAPPAAPVLSA